MTLEEVERLVRLDNGSGFGAGHRYFLDEIAREHGYRWVHPGEWLPEPR